MRFLAILTVFLFLAGCGGAGSGGGGNVGGGGGSPIVIPLAISSPSTASFAENATGTVYQATTIGGSGAAVTFTLGGTDADQFALTNGTLTFKSPPDFEKPADADHNNVYEILITASDGTYQAQKAVSVTITNVPDQIVIARVGGTYSRGDYLAAVPGQNKLFVATVDGKVYLVDPATTDQGSLYLTVPNLGLHGLISIAAAPDYATSGNLYVVAAGPNGNMEVRRYGRLSAAAGDPQTELLVMSIPGALSGGFIGFGPDGDLYLGIGDCCDPTTHTQTAAQNLSSLQGKLLRIDVSRDDFPGDSRRNYGIPAGNPFSGSGGDPEIFAYGFQTPLHGGFDGSNLFLDDYYMQDGAYQEINLIRPQDAGGNYGWAPFGPDPAVSIPPVLRVRPPRAGGHGDIVGGYVYHGPYPQLAGQYFFSTSLAATNVQSVAASSLIQGMSVTAPECCAGLPSRLSGVVSFGEDANHNLYMLRLADQASGELYEIQLQ